MSQLTLRLSESLVADLKRAATASGKSVNAYAGEVLAAAVNPDLAGAEIERVRERLARAGLLATPASEGWNRPGPKELHRARAAAGRGRPLSEYVSEGRG